MIIFFIKKCIQLLDAHRAKSQIESVSPSRYCTCASPGSIFWVLCGTCGFRL